METLILLGLGILAICGLILLAQLFVWAWDWLDKRKERRAQKAAQHRQARRTARALEPRVKSREDYWAA